MNSKHPFLPYFDTQCKNYIGNFFVLGFVKKVFRFFALRGGNHNFLEFFLRGIRIKTFGVKGLRMFQ